MTAESLDGQCLQDFADQADEGANIDFTVSPAGALGGESDVQQNLFDGIFEATLMSSNLMGVWEESAQVLNLPYLIPDIETGREVINSDVLQPVYDDLLDNRGARVLGWCHFSQRNIAAQEAVRGPADLEGMTIRTPETDTFIDTFDTLGANPTALPFPDVYNSLSTGVVDAAESNFEDMLELNFYEVAPYFSRTEHVFVGQAIVVNERWFQGLAEPQRDALDAAAQEAEEQSFQDRLSEEETLGERLDEAGVTTVDDVDTDAFRQAVAEVRTELAVQYGVEDLLVEVEELIDEQE